MKHTPGPWKVILISEPLSMNGIGICQVNGPKGIVCNTEESTYEETQANANLIAAAPEMIEALEQALISLEYASIVIQAPLKSTFRETIEYVRATLIKAKGGE